MNIEKVEKALSEYNQVNVSKYCNYLTKLIGEKVWWLKELTEKIAIDLFKQVAETGLMIDGETITLKYQSGIKIEFGYQAYKKRVLTIYPETIFDMQLVRETDVFKFSKENGKVTYKHDIGEPFSEKPIIGAYCIIKNQKGEFLELISKKVLMDIREKAKTKTIWDAWLSEMALKSVIKRACKRQFHDITNKIDKIDNLNYYLEPKEKSKPSELFEKLVEKLKNKDKLIDKFESMDINEQRIFYRETVNAIKENKGEVIC
jgi:recombinational DNA repair protein RecT